MYRKEKENLVNTPFYQSDYTEKQENKVDLFKNLIRSRITDSARTNYTREKSLLIIRVLTRLRAREARGTLKNNLLILTAENNNKVYQRYISFTQKTNNLLEEITRDNFEKLLYKKILDTLINYLLDL